MLHSRMPVDGGVSRDDIVVGVSFSKLVKLMAQSATTDGWHKLWEVCSCRFVHVSSWHPKSREEGF